MIIVHNKPTLGKEEESAAIRVLRSGWVAQGEEVAGFEREFCSFLGLPEVHAVAVSSGTAALFLALWALESYGKSVALPVYACAALKNACILSGGRPILLDTSAGSPNMNVEAMKRSGADIAIIPHMFGLPTVIPDTDSTVIIEDCAQALGATVGGVPVGLVGQVGIYSFYATKLITSGGQGGMIVSRERGLIDAVRDYREFDCRRDREGRFNFKMTDIQAAIGRAQLVKLPGFIKRREEIFAQYCRAGLSLLDVSAEDRSHLKPVRYRAILKTHDPKCALERLRSARVTGIVPIEDWELLGDHAGFPNAAEMTHTTVSLPIYPSLTDLDVDLIVSTLRN